MASIHQITDEIREDVSRIYEEQGFLTEENIRVLWSDQRQKQFLSHNNNLGFSDEQSLSQNGKALFLKKRLKILLILIDINWPNIHNSYGFLKGSHLVDDRLPLREQDLGSFLLKSSFMNNFQKTQWRYIPQKIEEKKRLHRQRFERGSKLPFNKSLSLRLGSGLSGVVYKEVIPTGYYINQNNTPNTERKVVARKVFKHHVDHIEIDNLRIFRESRDTQNCIMTCLAILMVDTESGEEEVSIIMDKADYDLWTYLPYEADTVADIGSLRDLLKEAAELAGALAWLHVGIQVSGEHLACCHMDLKPNNVLLFDVGTKGFPVGKWKVADFGLSVIRTPQKRPYEKDDVRHGRRGIETIVTAAKRKAGPYVAPEVYKDDGKVGRNSDIWSYGCILADVIASHMTGKSALRELIETRNKAATAWFYDCDHGNLSPHFQLWLDSLSETCDTKNQNEKIALPGCKTILDDIFIVDLDERQRPQAKDIRARLLEACNSIPFTDHLPGPNLVRSDSEVELAQPIDLTAFRDSLRGTQWTGSLALDQRAEADTFLLRRMQEWISEPKGQLLWVDESFTNETQDVSLVSSGLSQVAHKEGFPVMMHICRCATKNNGIKRTKMEMLVNLVNSLICQLQTYLNQREVHVQPVSQLRFDALDGRATLAEAMSVLADLFGAMDSLWFCIIDGFHVLEDQRNPALSGYLNHLIELLYPPLRGLAPILEHKGKTLVTTSGRSLYLGRLPREIKWDASETSQTKSFILEDMSSGIGKIKDISKARA